MWWPQGGLSTKIRGYSTRTCCVRTQDLARCARPLGSGDAVGRQHSSRTCRERLKSRPKTSLASCILRRTAPTGPQGASSGESPPRKEHEGRVETRRLYRPARGAGRGAVGRWETAANAANPPKTRPRSGCTDAGGSSGRLADANLCEGDADAAAHAVSAGCYRPNEPVIVKR